MHKFNPTKVAIKRHLQSSDILIEVGCGVSPIANKSALLEQDFIYFGCGSKAITPFHTID